MPKKPVVDSSYHPKRPAGLEGSSYKTYRNWSYKKWAWEFLRRNHYFQVDCLKVENGTHDEKQKVANDYGLKVFKKYTDAFKGKKSGAPKFFVGIPSVYKNTTADEIEIKRIRLSKTQIAIRFDLQFSNDFNWSIKTQIERAKSILTKDSKTSKPFDDINLERALYLIRLLDGISNTKVKTTQIDCYKALNAKSKLANLSNYDMQMNVKNDIKAAKVFAEKKYRYFGALKGKPIANV